MPTAAQFRNAPLTRLALAAAAYGLFAAAEARAGCGDHVVVLSSLSADERSFFVRMMVRGGCQGSVQGDPAAQANLAALTRCATCPLNPLREGPCRGPYCSDERVPDGVPVSSAPTRHFDPWNLFIETVKVQQSTLAGYLQPADASDPIARADSIFHPPRAA